jgi:hypothetical protein
MEFSLVFFVLASEESNVVYKNFLQEFIETHVSFGEAININLSYAVSYIYV